MKYVGAAATTFKARWYNHKSTLSNKEKQHSTALSTFVWQAKDLGMEPDITYKVLAKAPPYSAKSGRCSLCLQEKVHILLADPQTSLNRRREIAGKCRHRHKCTLGGWTPGVT